MKSFLSKILVLGLLLALVGPLEKLNAPSPEFEEGGIRANTLSAGKNFQLNPLPSASLQGVVPAYEQKSIFLSEVMKADFPFDAVGVEWKEVRPEGTQLEMEMRFQTIEKTWTNWQHVEIDIDGEGEDELISTQRSDAFQYRITMESEDGVNTPRIQNLKFHYIDASVENSNQPVLQKSLFGSEAFKVIPRTQWGADESFRLSSYFGLSDQNLEEENVVDVAQELQDIAGKNGEKSLKQLYPEEFEITETIKKNAQGESLYWPQEYAKNIQKIIIHHTASTSELNNPEAAIRATYYYHAVRRGWGDVGYNYIIDTQGNIYEGRAGGERVVAGHTQGYNTGSIGIAVLGNYEEDAVPYEVINALATLIKAKADLYDIQVEGFSQFRGEISANVMGHRDAAKTLCPGKNLYESLPVLRKLIGNNMIDMEGRLGTALTDKPYEFVSASNYGAFVLDPEKTSRMTIKIKNIGTETWNQETYLVADQNERAERMVHLVKETGNTSSIGRMIESSVAPGEIATFNIDIEAKLRGGFENYQITPLFNGTKKTRHYLDLPIYVAAPSLKYDLVDLQLKSTRVKAGEKASGTLKLRNTGNITWKQGGEYPMEIQGGNGTSYAKLKEVSVGPGQIGTFELSWMPSGDGSVSEALIPFIKNLEKVKGANIKVSLIIYDTLIRAEVVSLSEDRTFAPDERKAVWITLKNTGNKIWDKNGENALTIGKTHHPDIKVTKPILATATLGGGKIGQVRFSVKAPSKAGNYVIYLRPRLGGQNLMQEAIKFEFTVKGGGAGVGLSPATPVANSVVSVVQPPKIGLDQETIRIKLSYDTGASGAPQITANGAFDLYLESEFFMAMESGDKVEVRRTNGRYQILSDARAWVVEEIPRFVPRIGATILEIDNYEHRPAWNTALNDNQFRGILEVQDVDGTLTVINELSMEDYLKGIGEVENGAPTEKIRTMMILARTYARYYLSEDEKFPGMPYDLSDDPDESQKYLGYGYEKRAPNIVKAVRDTRGKVVTYKGKLVKTPYFSTTDGTATKSAQAVWGWTHTPYLVSVPDPLCTATRFSGHGVGLSGCGATQAALNGNTYEQIIKYYYTGVEIEQK